MEMQYRMNDLANTLGVKESTARKYFLLIEKKGYIFQRNNQGHILFSQDDVSLFEEIIRLKNHPDYSIQDAIDAIINVGNNSSHEPHTDSYKSHEPHEGEAGIVPYQQFQNMKEEMTSEIAAEVKELLHEQNKVNQELLKNQRLNYEEELEEAKRQQQMYLDQIERIEQKLDEERKGFWAKLFGM